MEFSAENLYALTSGFLHGLSGDPALVAAVVVATVSLLAVMARNPALRTVIVLASLGLSLRYILWRGLFTLNTVDAVGLALSVLLLASEAFGIAQFVLFLYQTAWPKKRPAPAPAEGFLPTVDIFITVYDEPAEVLARSVEGCLAQDYPEERFKVFVLDDGRRDEIRSLAEAAGAGYITRDGNAGAKAGNVNNALGATSGELVAVFDCDHVPVRTFLQETVPSMADPTVAFVQTPHHFYNPDIFQRNLRVERELANEQDLFFRVIQPGRDRHNAAFFAGSGGIFRRKPLMEIGGFMEETVTEDIHTSMELHSRGYRSVFLDRVLSAGLSPEDSLGYIKQRKRWSEGAFQLILRDNPLFKKGLTLGQRLCYFSSMLYFFHWLPRLVYLTAPLAYLLGGYTPISTTVTAMAFYFIPHYAVQIITFGAVSRGTRNPFWSDVYETMMCFSLAASTVKTFFGSGARGFEVTPKGLTSRRRLVRLSVVAPHLGLLALLFAGVVSGASAMYMGTATAGVAAISLVWACYNLLVTSAAILTAVERPQVRGFTRLARRLPCEMEMNGERVRCFTRDISEGGALVRLEAPARPPGSPVDITILGPKGLGPLGLRALVVREDLDSDGGMLLGLRFLDVDPGLRRGLIRLMYSPEDSWSRLHQSGGAAGGRGVAASFIALVSAAARGVAGDGLSGRLRSAFSRGKERYPCRVIYPGRELTGAASNLSSGAVRVETRDSVELPPTVEVEVYGEYGAVERFTGTVAWRRETRSGGMVFTVETEKAGAVAGTEAA